MTGYFGAGYGTLVQEARTAAAMKLFEKGRLSCGQAAPFAGVQRVEFLLTCRHWGVNSANWDDPILSPSFQHRSVESREAITRLVVCNSGPLIALGGIDRLGLLRDLLSRVLMLLLTSMSSFRRTTGFCLDWS